jgi:heterotetrameric sarcosine oxidase gamma subunit
MSDLARAPVFAGMTPVGEGGGVHVRLLAPAIFSVLARKDQTGLLLEKTQAAFGLALRDAPKRTQAGEISALGIGPGRWLFLKQGGSGFADQLSPLSAHASLSDHSDGYAVFEVSGPRVRDALAKGVPVDLHPSVFTDDVAVTSIAHIGAIVWQSAPDRFAIAVFRSFAGSLWHWLAASAAELGLAMDDGP